MEGNREDVDFRDDVAMSAETDESLEQGTAATDVDSDSSDADFADEVDIRETDIVFDCPHCGHNLVIDYRGAGMVITCVECGKPVQVPIPEGMQLSDLDHEPESLQMQLGTLRTALLAAEERERELSEQVTDLKEKRAAMERARTGQLHRLAEIRGACEHIQHVLTESSSILNRIFDMIQSEMRQ